MDIEQFKEKLLEKIPSLARFISKKEVDDTETEQTQEEAGKENDDKTGVVEVDDLKLEREKPSSILEQIKSDPEKRRKAIMIAAVIATGWLLLDEEPEVAVQEPTRQVKVARKKKRETKKAQLDQPKEKNEEVKEDAAERLSIPKEEIDLGLDTDSTQQIAIEEPEIEDKQEENVAESVGEDSLEKDELGLDVQENIGEDKTNEVLSILENKLSQNMEEKKTLIYTTPRYDISGRGLVYSCKGGHWACIDGENYGKCEKNYDFTSKLEKTTECVPKEVYVSNKDCSLAQQEKIDKNNPVDFCKKI